MSRLITGAEFKAIRELCGYGAREVAEFLTSYGTGVSTVRGVYRLEKEQEVPWRYTEALEALVGMPLFEQSLREVRKRGGEPQKGGEKMADGYTRPRPVSVHTPEQGSNTTEDRFLQFLNTLPATGNTVGWITTFRDALCAFLGDVDRVVINVNIDCDIDNPERYEIDQIMTEYLQGESSPKGHFEITTARDATRPWERLLEGFRRHGYPLERYRQPHAFDYYLGEHAYLGTIFLWRELGNQPISDRTLRVMEKLEPFFRFAFSDLVARSRQSKPQDRAFNDALSFMVRSAGLTDQERRVVMLQLFGHSYEQIAAKLYLSLDAVRKHVKNIYRKTDTHSYIELFAKYFTPRLGF